MQGLVSFVARLGFAALIFLSVIPTTLQAKSRSFDWHFQNNSGEVVNIEIYSKTRPGHVWPGNGQVWIGPPNGVAYRDLITCERGEKICYGAWLQRDDNVYWGAGHGGSQFCSNCCYTCNGGNSEVIGFDSAQSPTAPGDTAGGTEGSNTSSDFDGGWKATSTTSIAITGNIRIGNGRISFGNGASVGISPVDGHPGVFRFDPPGANPTLLQGNKLCGDAPPRYLTLYGDGSSLGMTIYESPTAPNPPTSSTLDYQQGACASYGYER
jgi:hypothetical protein